MSKSASLYFNRRMGIVLALGAASGLPLVLTADTLQAWMVDAKVDLATIGLFSLIGLPYALKFFWSPLLDRFIPPLLDRRRGWLVLSQLAIALVLLTMGLVGMGGGLGTVARLGLLLAFFSATQDIVADAWRTDILPPRQRGAGAAVWVAGYRLGMITAGAGALYLSGRAGWSWPTIYKLMAALMLLATIATWRAERPGDHIAAPRTLRQAIVLPLQELLTRKGGGWVLAFVLLYKLPEVLATSMSLPFLMDLGMPKEQIASIRQMMGILATIGGALAGGVITARLGLYRALWVFGIMHGMSNLSFAVLQWTGLNLPVAIVAIIIENGVIGLTTAGFGAFLMARCDPRYSATQFALFSSLMALGRVGFAAPAGFFAQRLGWELFFLLSITTAIPGLFCLWRLPAAARH